MDPVTIGLILSAVIPLLNQVISSLSFLQENRDPTEEELNAMVHRLETSTAGAQILRDHLLSLKPTV